MSDTGWMIPDDLLVDLSIVGPGLDSGVYLASVTITPKIISIAIASCATGKTLGTAYAIQGITPAFSSVSLTPFIEGVKGFVVFGSILNDDRFAEESQRQGRNAFSSDTQFERRTFLSLGDAPVRSLTAHYADPLFGIVTLASSDTLQISVGEGDDSGDPVSIILLSLAKPLEFLSPCENPTTTCECQQTPISTINGVQADDNGNITIEIEDNSGQVTPVGTGILDFLITRTGSSMCSKPAMPDIQGRLPGTTGDYTTDVLDPLGPGFENP